ncbi:MAG: helicase-related protein [Candidatus Peribacteraceae bacterium]|nr:helicase-related protein [Candidatus Peribacteraceae bacterium]
MPLSKYQSAFQEKLAARFEEVPHSDPSKKGIKLEDHQHIALEAIYNGLLLNRDRMCAVASCGSGKTLVEIAAISASQAAKEQLGINGDRKDLVITEERAIVAGIRRQFARLGIETGIWTGGRKELEQPVIIAGIHALQAARSRRELTKILPPGTIDLCVLDEADCYLTQRRIKTIESLNPRIVTGFTATEKWPDGRHISDQFGPVVDRLNLVEAMKQKINVVPDLYIYESAIKEDDLRLKKDDYDPAVLQAAWKHAELHKAIPEVYGHLLSENLRRAFPTLVYVPSRDMVHATAESLREQYPEIAIAGLTGKDETDEVEEAMEGFRNGEVQIIVLCEMGKRGMDLENAMLLIDAYPTKSLNKLEQRHGRVLRKIRPGSALWQKGWRKNGAIIAQIAPKAGTFRPALFTDIIGGWEEFQRVRGARDREGGGGAPEENLIAQVRAQIESKRPPAHVSLVRRVDILEQIRKDRPQFDEDGFFRIPRRYVKREPPDAE